MKIVQTLWISEKEKLPIYQNNGWLAPEYHWMSWALSCLQLSKFYNNVELYANAPAIDLLINHIHLPYSVVNPVDGSLNIPDKAWALAKIYTYSLQHKPFLHVDGDVFIWERFNEALEQAPLVSQNVEIGFPFYSYFLEFIQRQFKYIPTVLKEDIKQPVHSCNAGVIGGSDIDFFQLYTKQAIKLVLDNLNFIDLIDSSVLCMSFEQLLFYRLAQKQLKVIQYVHTNPVDDTTYPGFANFYEVPYKQKYIHTMGEFKRKKYVCDHLAKRLRKDYPVYYYRILKCCQEAGISLTNRAYGLDELSPSKHSSSYFLNLPKAYINGEIKQGSWLYFYAKDVALYESVENLFSLDRNELLQQILVYDEDTIVSEIYDPNLKQTLKSYDPNSLSLIETELDELNMLLVDAFLVAKSINQTIEEISIYFDSEEVNQDFSIFQNLVLDRVKDILYLGGLHWVGNSKVHPCI